MSSTNILHLGSGNCDPQIERLLEKLEETCERVCRDDAISTMQRDPTSAAYIPLRIKEIIKETLSPLKQDGGGSLTRENILLQRELQHAKKENQDLGTKYIAVSEKIEQVLMLEQEVRDLRAQNSHLKLSLEDKEDTHSLHLRAYQDGQEKQDKLVQQLQTKIEEYEFQCNELKVQLEMVSRNPTNHSSSVSGSAELEQKVCGLEDELIEFRHHTHKEAENHHKELSAAMDKLDEQQKKVVKLAVSNQALRQQLEESQNTNSRLTEDIHQLTAGWTESQQKLKENNDNWKKNLDQETHASISSHHLSLAIAKRDAGKLKTEIYILKNALKRDLSTTQSEIKLLCSSVGSIVEEESRKLRTDRENLTSALKIKEEECSELASELSVLKADYQSLRTKHELTLQELEKKVEKANSSLSQTKHDCQESTKVIGHLEASNADLATTRAELDTKLHESQINTSSLRREVNVLKSGLEEIVQLVSEPEDQPKTQVSRSSPCLPVRVISGKGSITIPVRTRQQETAEGLGIGASPILAGSAQVKLFGTPCDVKRVKEWVVSVVKQGVTSRDETIKALKSELVSVQDTIEQQQVRISELNEEMEAHSSTNKMTKKELESCNEQLAELNRNKTELELQLEEAVSQKKETERRFAQSAAKVDSLTQDKDKNGTNTSSLEEANRNLKYDLEQAKQEFQLLQIELTNKQNGARKLEMQLHSVEEEAQTLRERITYLEAVKLGNEKEMAEQTLSIDTLKMEKSDLQRELKELQESEATTVGALTEIQAKNKELEQEKRLLTKSLKKVTDRQVKLDEENVELEKTKITNEDQLQKLKGEHSHLSGQVDELDKSLGETEISRMDAQCERDQLKHEVEVLSEALGKSKQALAEVQIQRGKLSNKIAVMAQEKGDLITGKVELGAEVVKLQESLHMSKERIASLHVIKDRLDQKIEDLEKKLAHSEMSVCSLEEEKFLLQQEKHDLQIQQDKTVQEKDEEISTLHNQKTLELQYTTLAAKAQEAKLQNMIQHQAEAAQKELVKAKRAHGEEVATLTQQHEELAAQLKEELEAFSKVHDSEVTRRQKDKEMAVARLENEKALLNDRIDKLQKMADEKSENLVQQQRQSSSIAAEQKAQLDVSGLNAHRLETELVASEKRLWDLQNKLDEVKKKASDQMDSLKSQLGDISHTVTKLEAFNDDAKMTIKTLENQNSALQRQGADTQRQLVAALKEKESLQSECRSLQQKLSSVNIELSKQQETVGILHEKLSQAEEDLSAVEKDATSTHKSLAGTEQAHAKLVFEHASLQSSFTSSEKQNTELKIELKSALEKVSELKKIKETLENKVDNLESKFKIVSEKCQLKEQEAASRRLRATQLEKEKNQLSIDLSKAHDQSRMQDRLNGAKLSEYESTTSDLKGLQDHLQDKLARLETALEGSQANRLDVESKLAAVSRQAANTTAQLKQTDALHSNLQARYAQLLGVLEGTLGVTPSVEDESMSVFSPSGPNTTFNFSLAESRPESGFGGSIASPLPSLENSLSGEFLEEHSDIKSPSKLSKLKLDANTVRDAILDLQKRVMAAERSKYEAIASATDLKKNVLRHEEEKQSLEARLKSLRSSLTSLQTSFDSVSKQRDHAELSSKINATSLSDHEQHKKDLQQEVVDLKKQLESDRAAKKESESKLKQCVHTQVSLEMDRNKLETRTKQLELQRRQLEEEIVKSKSKLSQIETTHVKKDAEIARLQQKLVTSQHLYLQIEEQLKSLKEANRSLGTSYKLSQESEKRLLEKIQQLEFKLTQAQGDKKALEKKITDLQETLALVKREKELLEDDLRLLTRNQLESDTECVHLQEKVKDLNISLSDQEVSKAQLSTQLQSVEMKLQEQEGGKQMVECRLSDMIREKLEMSARLRQLEGDLDAANKEKQIANHLCGSLEAEIDHIKNNLHKLRGDHSQLKDDLHETALQNSRLDAIITDQQRQKAELDHTLVESSKQSVELMKTVRQMKESMAVKDNEQEQKMKVMVSEVGQTQGTLRMHDAQWTGKEHGYKKTIDTLESKVHSLEKKLNETKRKKAAYLQKAQEHDESIQSLRSEMEDSITALATGEAHIPTVIEKEAARLKHSYTDHHLTSIPASYRSPSSRPGYSYSRASHSPSPSRFSVEDRPFTSTPKK